MTEALIVAGILFVGIGLPIVGLVAALDWLRRRDVHRFVDAHRHWLNKDEPQQ